MQHFEKKHYGTMPDGTPVHQFILRNNTGIELRAIEFGGIITHLFVPNAHKKPIDVVMGHDSLEDYLASEFFFGAIIGRFANRISQGSFSLDGKEYQLPLNDGSNNLHSGPDGLDRVLWSGKQLDTDLHPTLSLTYISKHGEQGFPGQLSLQVLYRLSQDALEIEYRAKTDQTTLINLTHHDYFNLTGLEKDSLSHELTIQAEHYLPTDDHSIPLPGKESVEGTPFDFRFSKTIGSEMNEPHPQLLKSSGYDHNFILDQPSFKKPVASAHHPFSGITMEVFTTEPGLQFYSGNHLSNSPLGKNGVEMYPRCAFCLETQHFPDSPNRPDFPNVVLKPEDFFTSKTTYRFRTDQL